MNNNILRVPEEKFMGHILETRFDNSDIIKKTIFSLITVATPKTSDEYAWSCIKNLLIELRDKYPFLKYIKIGNIENIDYEIDDINVTTEINRVNSSELGRAIQDIIDLLKKRLGNKAGYFFLEEFKHVLGEKYYSIIKNMGVDLRLIELKNKLYGFDTEYRIKDRSDTNIAFLEKK